MFPCCCSRCVECQVKAVAWLNEGKWSASKQTLKAGKTRVKWGGGGMLEKICRSDQSKKKRLLPWTMRRSKHPYRWKASKIPLLTYSSHIALVTCHLLHPEREYRLENSSYYHKLMLNQRQIFRGKRFFWSLFSYIFIRNDRYK